MNGHLARSALIWLVAATCSPAGELRVLEPIPETVLREGSTVRLNIPDRRHAPEAPRMGWCGENAIQQALLFHGAYFPQKAINQAGHPTHPDLYSHDIPLALKSLGVAFEPWRRNPSRFDDFFAWMKQQVEAGSPVLAGVKIYPTAHPEWGLDHFVLVVGCAKDSLTLNTTWGRQETRTKAELFTTQKGLSFRNRSSSYYGIRIAGFAGRGAEDVPVRLFVLREEKDRLEVAVKCEGLTPGQSYVVTRSASVEAKAPARSFAFRAERAIAAFADTIDAKLPAIFRCRPTSD